MSKQPIYSATDLACLYKVSRNTVLKIIREHNLQPVYLPATKNWSDTPKMRKKYFSIKDLQPVLKQLQQLSQKKK